MKKLIFAAALLLLPVLALCQTAPRCNLAWGAVTTNVSGATITGVTYNVYRGLQSNGSDLAKIAGPISSTTYTDLTINGTTQYYFAVSAISSAGIEGGKSNIAGFRFGDLAPSAPPNLILAFAPANPGRTSVKASWLAASIPVGGQCFYRVYRNSILLTATSALSYIDANLKKNMTITYAVSCLSVVTGIEGPRSTATIRT